MSCPYAGQMFTISVAGEAPEIVEVLGWYRDVAHTSPWDALPGTEGHAYAVRRRGQPMDGRVLAGVVRQSRRVVVHESELGIRVAGRVEGCR